MINNIVLENLTHKYGVRFFSLTELEEKYLKPVSDHIEISESTDNFELPEDVVVPDEKYVKYLIELLEEIRENLDSFPFGKCKKGLEEILNEGDFEYPDEIMNDVHELIKKYIYGNDTSVAPSDWLKLEKYIEDAGYIPVPVKVGDDVTPFKLYFDRPIQAMGGIPNTIKTIQLRPYKLKFYDGEMICEELKLCGKCTYYV